MFGLKWRTLVFVGRHNMPSTSFVHALNCAPRKASATSRKGRITGSNRPFSTSKLQLENHPMFFQIADFNLRCVISETFVIRPINERCWLCDQVVPFGVAFWVGGPWPRRPQKDQGSNMMFHQLVLPHFDPI